VYDETWISRSGAASVHSFRPFADFLRRRYEMLKSSQSGYVIFRRLPPA